MREFINIKREVKSWMTADLPRDTQSCSDLWRESTVAKETTLWNDTSFAMYEIQNLKSTFIEC